MAISDAYVIQSLLQGTTRTPNPIEWSESDETHVSFATRIGTVGVELSIVSGRSRPRVAVRLSADGYEVTIDEPAPEGFFRVSYANEADQQLAELLRRLAAAVGQQCLRRKVYSMEHSEELRERIYRRLLFGDRELEQETVKGEP